MALLATKNIKRSFGGVHAVDGVSLTFNPGTITALIGPNGSGKSTFINLMTGMLPIESGTVIVSDSVEFSSIQAHEVPTYGMTRTFQNIRLIGQLSVLDNILLTLTERGIWGSFFEQHSKLHVDAAEDLLRKVGLWEKRDDLAENLSYGQRKLLEIARALSLNARIYFFDEPFAGLFTEMVKTISGIFSDLRNAQAAVVLVEHNMDLVRELADYCYVLDSGKVIAEGKPEEALARETVIEAYLGK